MGSMPRDKLHPQARLALLLTGFYWAAEALCSIFVSVYLFVNSHDLLVVFRFYTACYLVTPIFFLLGGWYAQARDRVHVYRLGLALHAVYYGTLLLLREQAPEYDLALGAMLGVAWGCFWAGGNTITFDVTSKGRREYYFGTLAALTGVFQLVAPVIGGAIIEYSADKLSGYHRVFAVVVILYLISFVLTFRLDRDNEPRPYKIRRALFPGPDQRDWRYILMASASLAGTFNIFQFLLGILIFMETENELSVGGFASYQAVIGIVVSYLLGRAIVPATWKRYLFLGTVILVAGGVVVTFDISVATLILFGLTRTVSGTMVNIPHSCIRFTVISESVEHPAQRIEYLCAWEVPLAVGRVIMMGLMIFLYYSAGDVGLRIMLLVLCLIRILTYWLLTRTNVLRAASGDPLLPAASPLLEKARG